MHNHGKCCGWIGAVAFILVVIGGINWGLVGVFNFDLVAAIFGSMSVVARIVYVLVGVAAIYKIFTHCHKGCGCGSKEGTCCGASMSGDTKAM